ncbi:hypothetical protein ACLB2K_035529 [Fragaria x ananassa]
MAQNRRLRSTAGYESSKKDRETERRERFEHCSGDSKRVEIWNQQNERPLWWHVHVLWLHATVYGALIIHPRSPRSYPFPTPFQDVPIMLGYEETSLEWRFGYRRAYA